MNRHLATLLTPPLLPLLLAQGFWVRRRTPRLPDACGPLEGTIHGDGEPLKLIALGESTVAGVGAATHQTGLTGQLAVVLNRQTKKRIDWLVVARTGINARKSRLELVPKLKGQPADIVLVALGVNDSIEFHTARRWASDMEELIEAARAEVGNVPIILSGVPPLDCFPLLPKPLSLVLGARSAALGQALVELAQRVKGIVHVPFQIEKERRVELFCEDGFHPSELGYQLWAEQLAAAFLAADSRGFYESERTAQ